MVKYLSLEPRCHDTKPERETGLRLLPFEQIRPTAFAREANQLLELVRIAIKQTENDTMSQD